MHLVLPEGLFISLMCYVHLHRFDEFGTDGGPAAKELSPKLAVVQRFLTSKLGEGVPKIDVSLFFYFLCFLVSLVALFMLRLASSVVNLIRTFFIQVSYVVAASVVLKGLGGALFVFGSSLGAYLLVRTICSSKCQTCYIFQQ